MRVRVRLYLQLCAHPHPNPLPLGEGLMSLSGGKSSGAWRGDLSIQRVAELLTELIGEFSVVETLVLRSGMLDFQRPHQVSYATDGHPVVAFHDSVDQRCAHRIPASCAAR